MRDSLFKKKLSNPYTILRVFHDSATARNFLAKGLLLLIYLIISYLYIVINNK